MPSLSVPIRGEGFGLSIVSTPSAPKYLHDLRTRVSSIELLPDPLMYNIDLDISYLLVSKEIFRIRDVLDIASIRDQDSQSKKILQQFAAIVLCNQDQHVSERAVCIPVMWFGQTLYLGIRQVTGDMAPPI